MIIGHYIDCEFEALPLACCGKRTCALTGRLDFRMVAKAAEDGKQLDKSSVLHLMALFGTFPPEVPSEP